MTTSMAWWQSMTRTPMTTSMIAWHCMTRTSMTTSMIAWHCTMRTPLTTSTDIHMSGASTVSLSFSLVRVTSSAHALRLKTFESFHVISMVMSMWVVLLDLTLPFYFLHFLTSLIFFLQFLKFVVNLHTPPNESMESTDEFSLSTGYEPKAYYFNETSVEPYMQLLDSPPLFSDKVSSADPDYDDGTLEDMLHEAHRAQAYHSPREDLSVSLSSSSMSDRTGRPVGERTGRPVEQRNQEAQIRTLLDKQKEQILAECQARNNQSADSFKDNYGNRNWNFVKLSNEVSLKWKS